ncbi:MAG TPA: sensor domain-containing diguanylate cyclase [Polyangiales bacterium]|nr:sensor domain-containing diguanylate cyclase [Polyangiales bacterium]
MTAVVQAAALLQRSARTSYGFAVAFVLSLFTLSGLFAAPLYGIGVLQVPAAVGWVLAFVQRARTRFRAEEKERVTASLDLEIALMMLAGVHALVQRAGGLTAQLYPLVYVLVAFVATFAKKPTGTVLVGAAVVFEAALYFFTENRTDPQPFFLHATFIVFFGLMNLLFTRVEIERVREKGQRALDDDKREVIESARRYRLVDAPSQRAERDEQRLTRGSVEQVRQAVHHTLDLLKRTLELHTCALFLLDGDQLQINEIITDSTDVVDGPFHGREGVVGAVMKTGALMNLEHLKPGFRGLCYYAPGRSSVRAFLCVPVIEAGKVRGALCADRVHDVPFGAREEDIVERAVRQVLRALENERVFVQLERTKVEQTVLHQASQALGAALTEAAVIEAGLAAAAQIAPFDFAAVTRYDAEQQRHSVRRAVGEGADELKDLSFRDNSSLTAMAVKNRHYLPFRGGFDGERQVVYTRSESMSGMQSLLILPLMVREDPVGTLALAARRADAFAAGMRPTLQVLSNQLAVALANAESVRRLEELATTDGLTGCLNKRAFLEEMHKRMKVAERFGKPLSLIVTDIDHFKKVNDTYGHAVGDHVIRALGEILRGLKRGTDVVARFGGEEFCILCEETDSRGAVLLAERVREQLAERSFDSELGSFGVTCSLGVAAFPDDAVNDSQLFELADKALYAAKQSGRNRVCLTPRKQAAG